MQLQHKPLQTQIINKILKDQFVKVHAHFWQTTDLQILQITSKATCSHTVFLP